MPDREKLMRAIEACANSDIMMHCSVCPYYEIHQRCVTTIMRDALALLKGQEPRVLIFEELHVDADEPVICYIEFKDNDVIDVTAPYRYEGDTWIVIPYIGTNYRKWLEVQQYGKTWRCWTSYPTDEQRKAVKWDA